jgi:hypothetical protein
VDERDDTHASFVHRPDECRSGNLDGRFSRYRVKALLDSNYILFTVIIDPVGKQGIRCVDQCPDSDRPLIDDQGQR